MSQAQEALDNDAEAVRELREHLPETSAASKSEARADVAFDDGSTLTARSAQGGDVSFEVVEPVEEE